MAAPTNPSAGIITGEAVALDLATARLPSRMLAYAIDFAITIAGVVIGLLLLIKLLADHLDDALLTALVLVVVVGGLLGYPVLALTLTHGRTAGKAALGLRVVRDDGGPIAFRQALTRELVGVVAEKPGPLTYFPGLLFILIREDAKRLGDLVAGTIVVNERTVGKPAAPASMPPGLAAWAAGLDLTSLPDGLALQARQLLGRAAQLRPDAREQLGQRLVAAVAAHVGPPPPGTPGWAYLAAVLAERRRRDEERHARRILLPDTGTVRVRPAGQAAYDDGWPADQPFPV